MWPAIVLLIGVTALFLGWRYAGKVRSSRQTRDVTPILEAKYSEKPASCPAFDFRPMPEFKWEETPPQQFRPWKPTYFITMALQNSAPADLITMDCNYQARIEYRRGVLKQHPEVVRGYIPEGVDAIQELYEFLLSDYLPKRFPTMFSVSADGKLFHNLVTGASYLLPSIDDPSAMLDAICETVEDDVFLLRQTESGHQSIAYVCVHCSGFDPSKKLGILLKEIHEPVPNYEKIGPSMEKVFGRMEVGKNIKRVNWSVVTTPELYLPAGSHVHEGDEYEADEDVDIDKAYMRVELQTLSRLPRTNALAFSFKTYLYPIKDVKDEGLGPQLADAIEGLKNGNAPNMWVYKGGVRWGKSILKNLRS